MLVKQETDHVTPLLKSCLWVPTFRVKDKMHVMVSQDLLSSLIWPQVLLLRCPPHWLSQRGGLLDIPPTCQAYLCLRVWAPAVPTSRECPHPNPFWQLPHFKSWLKCQLMKSSLTTLFKNRTHLYTPLAFPTKALQWLQILFFIWVLSHRTHQLVTKHRMYL